MIKLLRASSLLKNKVPDARISDIYCLLPLVLQVTDSSRYFVSGIIVCCSSNVFSGKPSAAESSKDESEEKLSPSPK